MFFHGTRVESDKFHVISPCMGCTCLLNENNISVRAKMSGPSTIKGDVLTIPSDAFCALNWVSLPMEKQFLKVNIVSPEREICAVKRLNI